MTRRGAAAILPLIFALPAWAVQPHTGNAILHCGTATLVARSTSLSHVGPEDRLIWVSQEIGIRDAEGASRDLRLADANEKPAANSPNGLQVIVSSWRCLHGTHEEVIELWLTCTSADLGGACKGQREWERLTDLHGRPLDEGYAPQDPRYEMLSRHLGIADAGIPLKDALGN